MFHRILIANRGEIAVRIIRTCREMEIETVAVYSTADAGALHVQLATESVCIGPAKAADSYLDMSAILTAALETGCDAIHPGYGFLSENAEFADLCEKCGLKFIGPSGDVIRAMGNKAAARALMQREHVPVVPGSDGPVSGPDQAAEIAGRIGYPVLLKASSGGGGRGMRRVDAPEDLHALYAAAQAEAVACFGDGELYVEKLILRPRHIEFQILADSQGNVVHLGERDCSIQRKNQKLIEESPSKALDPELREAMGRAAVAAAKAAGYQSAGTVEFVLSAEGEFYFIEMNTRIQVEHPVTEFVTGLDLIREQIRIAAGLPLSVRQEDVRQDGCAMECRINAEDPRAGFRPGPGTTEFLHLPGGPGVRVDTALYNGCVLPPYYDSLAAKVIVHAPTRLEVIRKMRRALEELIIEGYPTTADLCHLILHQPDFVKGKYDTGFLEQHMDELLRWDCEGEA
ncbi:MAG TPA: acetyl-CoA carboxylase biotin carboxylase subunit [Candidatus Intestinimonas stercoravium]|uniref:acetyl-CoA carboxylase biotin carboxylase subunit n=3 Tax=uncultured Intestinimonas sp. TaxID=1689265 RepID=UPI001F98EE05|nr:acetyl-CoA carboxylase biotin carboxylase subunit [uncultured Intestinimonas sp.]HJA62805.1 acetyl-CoA carboxylase biotin carboxylase subunit [Candidatus Intestinimonas stercoravium]